MDWKRMKREQKVHTLRQMLLDAMVVEVVNRDYKELLLYLLGQLDSLPDVQSKAKK